MTKSSFEEILSKDGYLIYPFKGISMLPLLKEGEDIVRIEPSNDYQKYDVVLFKRDNNQYVLHRIIEIKKDKYHIKGDNAEVIDIVDKDSILGKMVGYYHHDEYIATSYESYQTYMNEFILHNKYKYLNRINPYETKNQFVLNDNIKSAYKALFLYSVNPSYFNIGLIKKLTNEEMYQLYLLTLYKKSEHLLYEVINIYQIDIHPSIKEKLDKFINIDKSRFLYQSFYKDEISRLLMEHKIKHIFLKGIELRDRYHNPFLRLSNDIDIYVDKSDINRARELLIAKYHPFEFTQESVHYTFSMPNGKTEVELHFDLLEDDLQVVNEVIGDPFNHANKDDKYPYLYHLEDKYYYLYHLAHFAKHIKHGEFWIGMLQDTYLLKDNVDNELLIKTNLKDINDNILSLISNWEERGEYSVAISYLEDIFFMTPLTNYVRENEKKYKNKLSYIWHRLFLSKEELTTSYPKMNNRWYLYPYYFFKRLFSTLFSKHIKKPLEEIKIYNSLGEKELNKTHKAIGIYF